jgi:hypothetical protein
VILPCGGFIVGLVMIIVVLVRRSSAKKRMQNNFQNPGFPPMQYPPAGY